MMIRQSGAVNDETRFKVQVRGKEKGGKGRARGFHPARRQLGKVHRTQERSLERAEKGKNADARTTEMRMQTQTHRTCVRV